MYFYQYFRLLLRRLQHCLFRLANWLSLGLVRWRAAPYYLGDFYQQSSPLRRRPEQGPVPVDAAPAQPRSLLAALSSSLGGSTGCVSGSVSGGSSDSESDAATSLPTDSLRRRRSQRNVTRDISTYQQLQQHQSQSQSQNQNSQPQTSALAIANEAVAHSYEDITSPDYHNYLWLSSQYDRTDLFGAHYFLPNWTHHLHGRSSDTAEGHGTATCRAFADFLQRLSALPDAFFPRRRITLPKRQKTLVIDLDETLVHATAASCSRFDFMVEVLISRTSCLYYVFKRPHLDYFLDVVSKWYGLVIYTASLREYADPVVDVIDGGRRYFRRRLFRQACAATASNHYLKDLSLVDPDLSKLCLIDNSAAAFALQPDNAIPIESWRDDRTDTALLELLPFLDALRFVEDVRSVLSLRRLSLFSVINK